MIERTLRQIWEQLRAKKPQLARYLEIKRTVAEVCRQVARRQLEQGAPDVTALERAIEAQIQTWRALKG